MLPDGFDGDELILRWQVTGHEPAGQLVAAEQLERALGVGGVVGGVAMLGISTFMSPDQIARSRLAPSIIDAYCWCRGR